MTITTATATRQGTEANNADGAAVFRSQHGTVGSAVIDLIGHHPNAPIVAKMLAEIAARIAPQRSPIAALMTAGILVADRGDYDDPEPNGVGVSAHTHEDGLTVIAWIGDSHAYGWNGERLHRYTTPQTLAELLHTRFDVDIDIAADADHIIATTLANATAATVTTVTCADPLVILTTDGIDDLGRDQLTALVAEHADNPQALADALVAAPVEDEEGYRDDVTVVVIRHHD